MSKTKLDFMFFNFLKYFRCLCNQTMNKVSPINNCFTLRDQTLIGQHLVHLAIFFFCLVINRVFLNN